ncbi:hypothetical protein EDB89DRAFT_1901124 [Lactarius sanguifluus]|nr:hypothetical protein EDB89DRAFT_1901124 [Lactarius sanguifluus]
MPPAASLPAAAAIAYWCRYRVTAVSWVDMAMVVVVVVVGVVVVITVPCRRGCVVTSWLTRVHPSLMGPAGVCHHRVAGHTLVGFATTAVVVVRCTPRSWSWPNAVRPGAEGGVTTLGQGMCTNTTSKRWRRRRRWTEPQTTTTTDEPTTTTTVDDNNTPRHGIGKTTTDNDDDSSKTTPTVTTTTPHDNRRPAMTVLITAQTAGPPIAATMSTHEYSRLENVKLILAQGSRNEYSYKCTWLGPACGPVHMCKTGNHWAWEAQRHLSGTSGQPYDNNKPPPAPHRRWVDHDHDNTTANWQWQGRLNTTTTTKTMTPPTVRTMVRDDTDDIGGSGDTATMLTSTRTEWMSMSTRGSDEYSHCPSTLTLPSRECLVEPRTHQIGLPHGSPWYQNDLCWGSLVPN